MSTSLPSDLEAFYAYVGAALNQGVRETPPEAMLRKWRAEREFDESCKAIREGVADVEVGRCRPLEQFDAEFRQKHELPQFGKGAT